MTKKKTKEAQPRVHEDLKGFKMEINSFGEISSNLPIEAINDFLNKNVEDKKLKDREALDQG
jgi:hypothetical protein